MLIKNVNVPNVGNIYAELPEKCPMCNASIAPNVISVSRNHDLFLDGSPGLSAALACPSCHKLFVAGMGEKNSKANNYPLVYVAPKLPNHREFEPAMQKVSTQFIEIYHQAEAAEAYGLNQVSGIAFRKSLEFLVKDYAILVHPEQSDEIKETRLAKCIEKFIDHAKIQATARAATWIGNDETHYIRKWENKDVEDLKTFISACAFWILADNAYREAETMTTP